MLNNRQNGRRRGRGRTPNNNNGGGQRNESRIDNRARGNAPQMLEKYKNLARDAQLSGDRVMTEYYLQFADHYFRIVSEARVRFEEQRRQRDDWRDDGDEGDDFDGMMRGQEDGGDDFGDEAPVQRPRQDRPERQERPDRQERNDRQDRGDRPERQDRAERPDRQDRAERSDRPERAERNDRPERNERPERAERPERSERAERPERAARPDIRRDRPQRAPRVVEEEQELEGVAEGFASQQRVSTIDVAVLPPSLGVTADAMLDLDDEPAPTPKRRGRPRKVVAEDAPSEG